MSTTDQWLRKVSLVVIPSIGDQALDLSEMHIQFRVNAADVETPNNAIIRVFNLSSNTAARVQKEYSSVILQAGYQQGNFGTIFKGTIKQIRRGRISATDTYLDILAADGDEAYNFAVINQSLKAGSTLEQRQAAIAESMKQYNVEQGYTGPMTGGILPRGKVLFGMARDYQRDLANTTKMDWSVQGGMLQLIPYTGYRPGDAVVMNAMTGMVGMPEQTNQGIRVRCLLNPRIEVGRLIQINNKDINQNSVQTQLGFPRYTDIILLAKLSESDGTYRVFVHEYEGDTRGNPWYSDLTCLAADSLGGGSTNSSVQAYG